jgi:hypothetical protein
MKFDKETVIKHHFWFLLAFATPLALAALLILMTVVSAEISSNRKKLKGELDAQKVSDPAKNQDWITEVQKRLDKTKEREKIVWEEAYNTQKTLFTWPVEIEARFAFQDGLFASEIKAEKGATTTANDPKAEANKVIKHFSGIVAGVEDDPETKVITLRVRDAKDRKQPPKIFRPTPKMKLTRNGKAITSYKFFEKDDPVEITYVEGKYFNDPLTEEEQRAYGNSEGGYRTQIDDILTIVEPANIKGGGVVQLGNWLYGVKEGPEMKLPPPNSPFLRYVAREWNTEVDISAEAWMAQEDLWIQRELYRLVRKTNDMVSVFDGKGGNEPGKWYTFTNPYWKLEISFRGKQLATKITNRLSRRQRLDIPFKVTLSDDDKAPATDIVIHGEPIDPNEAARPPEVHNIPGLEPTGIYRVEQAINWESAAVKRIDHISMGSLLAGDCAQSQRLYPDGLKPFKPRPAKSAPAGGGEKSGVIGGDIKPPVAGGKVGGGQEDAGKTPNGLHTDRYAVQPKAEVRRVPFGISLIVGQEHIDRVLFSFSKSRLRILMTQVTINRYPHSVRPSGASQGAQPNIINRPRGPVGGGRLPGFTGGLGASSLADSFGGGIGAGRQNIASLTAGGDSQETNVEMVIYGIASLYQRYPPRPAAAAATN